MKKVSLELVVKVLVFGLLTLASVKLIFDVIVNGSNIL